MEDEIDSQHDNTSWKLCELPPGHKPLHGMWIYKLKRLPDGTFLKKSRWVINGKHQKPHQFKETSAPVAGIPTIKMLLVEGFMRNMIIDQLDIKTAYLYGDIDVELHDATKRI
jgi:hypothetical protein